MKFTWSYLLPVLLLIAAGALETTARDLKRKHGSRYRVLGPRYRAVAQDEDAEASGRVISTGFINRLSSLKGGTQCSTAPVTSTTYTYYAPSTTSTGSTTTTTTTTTAAPTTTSPSTSTSTSSSPPTSTSRKSVSPNDEYDEYDDYYYDDYSDDGLGSIDSYQSLSSNDRRSPVGAESSDTENENEDDRSTSKDYVEAESVENDILTEERAAQDQPSSFAPRNQARQWNIRQQRRRVPANRRRRRNNPRRRRNNQRRRRNNQRRRRNNLRRRRPIRIRRPGQNNRRIVRRRVPIRNGQRRVINLN